MNYRNILKLIMTTIIILGLSGCSISNINNQSVDNTSIYNDADKKVSKIKKIVYKRDEVSKVLLDRIYTIINAIANNNLSLINNNFIKKDFGFYNMFKTQGANVFTQQEMIYNIIEEDNEEIFHLMKRIKKDAINLSIVHKNVKFDCSPNDDTFYGWTDDGLYIKTEIKPLLSKMMKEVNIYDKNRYKTSDLLKAKLIEKTSYKVVLTPELSFTITKLENKWYITTIDRITTDCSSN